MLKIIWSILKWLLLGLIAAALIILGLAFYMSIPDLFVRLSYYIGDICTWIIFIIIISSIILISINSKR